MNSTSASGLALPREGTAGAMPGAKVRVVDVREEVMLPSAIVCFAAGYVLEFLALFVVIGKPTFRFGGYRNREWAKKVFEGSWTFFLAPPKVVNPKHQSLHHQAKGDSLHLQVIAVVAIVRGLGHPSRPSTMSQSKPPMVTTTSWLLNQCIARVAKSSTNPKKRS